MRPFPRKMVIGTVIAVSLIALWGLIVWLTGAPRFLLPGPGDVWAAFSENPSLIFFHLGVTTAEMLVSLLTGTLVGVVLGLWLALSPMARRILHPVLVFSQTVPIFALAPLLTLWFGYGVTAKLITATLVIFFPVASAFLDALLRTPPPYLELASVMGASRLRSLIFLRLPAARPGLASGLRLASVYAPIGAVLGEWVGSSAGLGYLMLLANGRAKTSLMFAALFALALSTLVLTIAVDRLARRIERIA